MKLNKIMLAAVMAFGATSFAQAADQGHGKVNFIGSIIDAPCSIAPESIDQTVDLGQVSNVALKNGGSSNPRSFDIKLEQCDTTTLKSVSTTFTGSASPTNKDLLGITGTASGAGVAITYGGQPVKLGTATTAQNLNEGSNTLRFAAYLQGEGASAAVVPGDFTAVADFTLAYQ
ncbi:Fimbria A protein precursor [Serratia rubidaea]|uniref:Fimbria A protein n=1 Tax=Serratia rubidaea TaxID=61652 RepID=A0A4U9H7R1_SERRU|nr:fimbrial protein [Serratia rubidaea]MBD8454085.1 type 1 fimbrial protein [Serratia rubidaea]QPR65049.1 type 1 fimbrial protein [Serratia rubidaea]UJD78251.1 type 1 fimbrial protein [Serratia rubidaea]UJD82802.1 type 1 fimbrial protein [Serratia rubidaea]CAI0984582.1 Fimbria A protein precursor [Serratia rubidaea]